MVNLIGNFSRLNPQRVLVAGDLMLDTYTVGKARRISPEAPVAVIQVESEEERPGGAGNTILNLISLGQEVVALGRVGNDAAGSALKHLLIDEGVSSSGLFVDPHFKTPIKNRIVSDNQQIVRVDHEVYSPLDPSLEKEILAAIPSLLKGVQVVAISDYGKGFLTPLILKALIDQAKKQEIFIIADPKGNDFSRYKGVDLLKPNLHEAFNAARVPIQDGLDMAAAIILNEVSLGALMVTRASEGISLFQKGKRQDFPVLAKQVKDVTGAGDTVLAMLTVALANKLPLDSAISLANVAAGIAIEHFGCYQVGLEELAKRLLEFDVANKVFDEAHLQVLKAALGQQEALLVEMEDHTPIKPSFIHALSLEKKHSGKMILVSLKDASEETLAMLAALQPIDFILVNTSKQTLMAHFPHIQLFTTSLDRSKSS